MTSILLNDMLIYYNLDKSDDEKFNMSVHTT